MGSLQVCTSLYSSVMTHEMKNSCQFRMKEKKNHTKNSLAAATVYNAYLDGLLKARCSEKAVEVYQRMKKERCRTNTETYTLMINVYGKVRHFSWFNL